MPTESTPDPRIIYAGDRDISVRVLRFLLKEGVSPIALLVPDETRASHTKELIALSHLSSDRILRGIKFKSKSGIRLLKSLKPDYIIAVHFPYIFPEEVLKILKYGALNLHPAYLPYNRGWNTPTWAIWEGTPYGATLHFMSEEVDAGDIVHQKRIEIRPQDTADSLYRRVMRLELEVFKEAWDMIVNGTYKRKAQHLERGTLHKKDDIAAIQKIDLGEKINAGDLIRKLRALTTNKVDEAAYFEMNGKKYRLQVKIVAEK